MVYSRRERFWLWVLALVGIIGLNGAFLYGLAARPDALTSALANPVAAAFMLEAFVLVGVLAYLLKRWQVSELHWGWFVVLSLIGGIVFALPMVLLWSTGDERRSA
jgi:uncharacterized membrane protein YhaH (DUF805 family)